MRLEKGKLLNVNIGLPGVNFIQTPLSIEKDERNICRILKLPVG